MGAHFSDKLPQVFLTHRQAGQPFTDQKISVTKSLTRACQHSFTELNTVMPTAAGVCLCGCQFESSVVNHASSTSKPLSTIPSWCLATSHTNPGQTVYVHASLYRSIAKLFQSSQIHQHERQWDVSLLHSIRNH